MFFHIDIMKIKIVSFSIIFHFMVWSPFHDNSLNDNTASSGRASKLKLNLHRPGNATGPLPCVVFVFGGGMANNNAQMYLPYSHYYAHAVWATKMEHRYSNNNINILVIPLIISVLFRARLSSRPIIASPLMRVVNFPRVLRISMLR
jgi:hypothetical protein